MPHSDLPVRAPNLDHLRKQAKDLLRQLRAGDAVALQRVRTALPHAGQQSRQPFRLHDTQSAIAREYGFASWAALKEQVQAVLTARQPLDAVAQRFLRAALGPDMLGSPRPALAQRLLQERPEVARFSLHTAAAAGELQALQDFSRTELLQAGGPLNAPALAYVCFSGLQAPAQRDSLLACAGYLLQTCGADPNTTVLAPAFPDNPLPCLYGAVARANDARLAALLLDAGAVLDDTESLYHSVEQRDGACTRLLLARGARFAGTNALKHMLDYEDLDGLRLCLAHGADVNEYFPPQSALHHAILRGRGVAILAELLAAGARLDARDEQGRTPLMLARWLGHAGAVALLQRHGAPQDAADVTTQFLNACAAADTAAARALLQTRPDLVTTLGQAELRLLPDQAQRGHHAAVELMLQLGFPVATQGDWDASALNQAAFRGDVAMARLLIQHGARWDELNGYGGDAFGSAIWPYLNAPQPGADYLGVIQLLLESGGELPDDDIDDEALLALFDDWRARA